MPTPSRRLFPLVSLLALFVVAVPAIPVAAAFGPPPTPKVDINVPGIYVEAAAVGTIAVDSWQFGVSRESTGPGKKSENARVKVSEISLSRRTDEKSPILMTLATGKTIPSLEIIHTLPFLNGGQDAKMALRDAFLVKLSDVVITSYSLSGAGEAYPNEAITLSYSKIDLKFRKNGKTSSSWIYDVVTGKAE